MPEHEPGAEPDARGSAHDDPIRPHVPGLLAASGDLILVLDGRGRCLSVVPTAASLRFRSRAKVVGRHARDLLPAATAALLEDGIRRATAEGDPVEIEFRFERGRESGWYTGTIAPLGDDRVAFFAREITARVRAEEALRESEDRFRATFEQAAVGIAHVGLDGRWLRVNRRLCEILGYSHEELFETTFQRITHPADLDADVAQVNRLLADEIPHYTMEKRYLCRNGQVRWSNLTVSLVRDASGAPKYFISVVESIHERKGLEQQLLQAQKMEALGQLAGGVAHDVNNALTAIGGFASLAGADLSDRAMLRTALEQIDRAAMRAAAVTRELLTFSRKQVIHPRVVDVNAVALGVERMLRQLIGEDVELRFDLCSEPVSIRADRAQIEQLIVNLAVNARDAMPRGGRLTLESRAVQVSPEYARTHLNVRPGSYVLLAVSDTGIGMPDEVLEHAFEPFYTTKPAGEGTGLGLAIVYGIVRQSEGTIHVYSEPGEGTTFRIYLPRTRGEVDPAEKGEPAPPPVRGTERILVVEDDPGVRKLASSVLENHGYAVRVAASGEAALRLLEAAGEPVDLLVTDVVMTGMSGRELATRLAGMQPGLRVLFTSGYTTDEVLRRGILRDEVAFLEKPFEMDDLLRRVREVLDR